MDATEKFLLGLVAVLVIVATISITNSVNSHHEYNRKLDALTQFELKCVKDNLPYCQEVIIRMEKELNVDYTKSATAED